MAELLVLSRKGEADLVYESKPLKLEPITETIAKQPAPTKEVKFDPITTTVAKQPEPTTEYAFNPITTTVAQQPDRTASKDDAVNLSDDSSDVTAHYAPEPVYENALPEEPGLVQVAPEPVYENTLPEEPGLVQVAPDPSGLPEVYKDETTFYYAPIAEIGPSKSPSYDAWIAREQSRLVQQTTPRDCNCPDVNRPVQTITTLRYDADPDSLGAYPIVYPQLTRRCSAPVPCICR
jgi:hypothetical protein